MNGAGTRSILHLRLARSLNSRTERVRDTARSLLLTRINDTAMWPATPCVLGRVEKIKHLLQLRVEQVSSTDDASSASSQPT